MRGRVLVGASLIGKVGLGHCTTVTLCNRHAEEVDVMGGMEVGEEAGSCSDLFHVRDCGRAKSGGVGCVESRWQGITSRVSGPAKRTSVH